MSKMKTGKQMKRGDHEYQLLTNLLAVNGLINDQSQCCSVKKEILSIYFFRFDGCTLVQCLHGLQYDESKRPCVA